VPVVVSSSERLHWFTQTNFKHANAVVTVLSMVTVVTVVVMTGGDSGDCGDSDDVVTGVTVETMVTVVTMQVCLFTEGCTQVRTMKKSDFPGLKPKI
jgi:hypothetical protein